MKTKLNILIIKPKLQSYGEPLKTNLALLLQLPISFTCQAYFRTMLSIINWKNLFSKAEIDEVIKNMPFDKAPGPDGFNGAFIKACWDRYHI